MAKPKQSLRKSILEKTSIDLRKCRGCLDCDLKSPKDLDLGFGSLVQLILMNDSDLFGSKLIWDDTAYEISSKACNKQLNLNQVIDVLREIELERE